MQNRDATARRSSLLQYLQRRFNLPQRSHAGGQNDRVAIAPDMAQIRQVGDLARGNLELIQPQSHQQIDTFRIEAG